MKTSSFDDILDVDVGTFEVSWDEAMESVWLLVNDNKSLESLDVMMPKSNSDVSDDEGLSIHLCRKCFGVIPGLNNLQ